MARVSLTSGVSHVCATPEGIWASEGSCASLQRPNPTPAPTQEVRLTPAEFNQCEGLGRAGRRREGGVQGVGKSEKWWACGQGVERA